MNVLALQLDIVWHDRRANHAKVSALLDRAGVMPNSLVILPEMFASGFSMDVGIIADDNDARHETEQFLQATARERKIAIMGGLVTRGDDGRGRNEAVIAFPDGREMVRYQKLQPFTLGGEAEHYTAGQEIVIFEWQGFKIAPFICYDLRFPELFRAAVLRGAEVFAVIANWPIARDEHWATLLKARAIENLCYVVGVNRCGKDPYFTYSGRSVILGPRGGEIAAIANAEGAIAGKLHLDPLLEWRRDFPALADIRPDFAGELVGK
ncbi:MAG TPA: nitrilase-related carbon-nitrogen hydrolase [Tepidisphaeraceae bacterium]|nr:nitrilase-related carbon-nitrogen hydrolase [Tepidisphaeraceae bacterium]